MRAFLMHGIRRKAFTLIELALVLVLVSLMTGFGLKVLQNRTPGVGSCYASTRDQLRVIGAATDTYARNNGAYPMPARLDAGISGTVYGLADSGANLTSTGGGAAKVWFGALPFATLKLPASYAADCWGNKFTYAVTDLLASSGTYAAGSGAITVRAGNWSAAPTACGGGGNCLSSQAAYVVVSRGENALVACQRNYTGAASGCYCNSQQADASVTRPDKENCDTNNADFYVSAFNNGANAANYFDDLVTFQEKAAAMAASCLPADVSWSTNCGGPVGQLADGASTIISNSKAHYSGSATVQCSNGTLSVLGAPAPSCVIGCDGVTVGGFCWYLGALNTSCDTTCTAHGGYNAGTLSYAGSGGTLAQCRSVLVALQGTDGINWFDNNTAGIAYGCAYRTASSFTFRYYGSPTTSASASINFQRACACTY
jgi:prepilin-type N-terminal cleavage/methylation domain-containing protein